MNIAVGIPEQAEVSFKFEISAKANITPFEVTEMAGYGLSKKKLQFMANDIGPKLLPFIPKEELLKQLTLEERLAGLTTEERRKLKQLLEKD